MKKKKGLTHYSEESFTYAYIYICMYVCTYVCMCMCVYNIYYNDNIKVLIQQRSGYFEDFTLFKNLLLIIFNWINLQVYF